MIHIIKQELKMEKSLKQIISFICEFCKTTLLKLYQTT